MSSIQGRPLNRYGSIIREESDDEMPQQDDLAVKPAAHVRKELSKMPREADSSAVSSRVR